MKWLRDDSVIRPFSAAMAATGVFVSTSLMAGCGTGPASDPEGGSLLGEWRPVEAPGADMRGSFDPDDARITFSDDGTYRGSDGCNGVAGEYELSDSGGFTYNSASTSGLPCNEGSVEYDVVFRDVVNVEFEQGDAVFLDDDDVMVLRLEPVAAGGP